MQRETPRSSGRSPGVSDLGGQSSWPGIEDAGSSFRFDVGADLIDLDHWAASYVTLRAQEQRSEVTRFGVWPVVAVAAVTILVVGLTSSPTMVIAPAALLLAVIGGVWLWNRRAGHRLAGQLRAMPAASEGFTFVADARGTRGQGPSSSEEMAWTRYRTVQLHEGLVALTRDNGSILFVPAAALVGASSADDAIAAMTTWIDAARAAVSGSPWAT